ncbi:nucleotide-diphosphate-sugar epimerase [Lentzea sp. NBRC 105346]|uniref:SDR family oxidoreductase n=1 Tax=Lentzea sp. NBRC 105346 TaxID=3032205 RepID=UPI0024A51E44|nr:NAD(P)H-binding protein [Lentzea sp. NBRC 105346]GLZ33684.1 nucleotide-diphosphate-sugar epimerase [Lentzea sp. NBRC 105346]
MTIVVTGGRGALGRHVVSALPDARAVSRSTGTDLLRGTGLSALEADTIVHCATSFRREVDMARAVLAARPRHLVYISIVGVDRVPFAYYRQKLAAEDLIRSSDVPWTILRATQFHSLLHRIFAASARLPLMFVPGFRFQPVAEAEVAAELARLASGPPAGMAPEIGGPEVRPATELARTYLAAAGKRRPVVPVRLPGRTFRAYRDGGNLTPGRAVGRVTFEDYLT